MYMHYMGHGAAAQIAGALKAALALSKTPLEKPAAPAPEPATPPEWIKTVNDTIGRQGALRAGVLSFSIGQMDVPTRQSYLMAVVQRAGRSSAGGITGVARTAGAAISPLFAGFLFSRPSLIDIPFFVAGALKILYDVVLYRQFVELRLPEEAD